MGSLVSVSIPIFCYSCILINANFDLVSLGYPWK